MEDHPLERLIALIEFDQSVFTKERALTHAQHELAELQKVHEQLAALHENAKQKLHNTQKSVHEHELTMKGLDATEQEKKISLETVPDPKAHQALRKEISHLKQQQYEHEKLLVQSWQELETAQKEFDEYVAHSQQRATDLSHKIASQQAHISTLERELMVLHQERIQKEASIPQEWREKYKLMHHGTNNPIVAVYADSCGGCFAQLPPQDLLNLKRKQLLQCPSCYRFLYWQEPHKDS